MTTHGTTLFLSLSLTALVGVLTPPGVAQRTSVCPPAGLVLGDVDGDGLDDAFLVGADGRARLLMNFGEGRFEDVTLAANLGALDGASCALFADLDGDGRVDLFTGSSHTRVWRNRGGATFEPVVSGIDHDLVDLSAQAVDTDKDGRLDLVIRTEAGDLVYRNLGDDRFERVELPLAAVPQAPTHVAWTTAPSSIDSADLLAAPDAGSPAQRRLDRWVQGRAAGGFASTMASAPSGTSSFGPSLPFLATCQPGVRDSNGGACIGASSAPTLGKLYPLSSNLFVASSGGVCIGTTTPSPGAQLDVASNFGYSIDAKGGIGIKNDLQVTGGPSLFLGPDRFAVPGQPITSMTFRGDGILHSGFTYTPDIPDSRLDIHFGAAFEQSQNPALFSFLSSGRLGIGTTTPGFTLEVNGLAHRMDNSSTWTVTSDERLKKNIHTLESGLETLLALRGVTFEYKDPARGAGLRRGFIAQEVEKVLPEWVEDGEDGYKRLTVNGFEALAVEALRALDARNTALQARNEELERRLAELESLKGELQEVRATLAALAAR